MGRAIRRRSITRMKLCGADGKDTDLRHLSRASIARLRVRRADLQTEIRPPRREPAGERSAHRQGRDHFAESWFCSRCRFVAAEHRSHARQSERRHRRRHAAPRVAGLQCAISSGSRARPARCQLFLHAVRGADRRGATRLPGAAQLHDLPQHPQAVAHESTLLPSQ